MESKKSNVKEQYELSAEFYDSRYEKIQAEKFKLMLAHLHPREPILDLGCGTGLLKNILKTSRVFGCDISFGMLKKARTRGELVVQADIDKLPFKNNSFASVLSFTSLQNLPRVDKALHEIKRVAKGNATLVITHLKKFDFTNQIRKEFAISEIRTLGEDIGFVLGK